MKGNSRRSFLGKFGATVAVAAGAPAILAQQAQPTEKETRADMPHHRHGNHIHEGIYYFSGTGSNDGYSQDDHILVTAPFEKHATRTMDALKKSLERAGCSMDSILHLEVFLCLPLADGVPMPTGKARFDAHKAQYDALNKIYRTYFSEGKAPSRACMALEWIPGDSLIEIVGSALVVNPSAAS